MHGQQNVKTHVFVHNNCAQITGGKFKSTASTGTMRQI